MAGPALGSGAPGAPDAGLRAARLLLIDREALAREVTDALYAESPELLERHGERGREKCLQDMRYNIEHLIPAVELADASMFARYVEWLDALLRSRGVATRDVVRCLELLRVAVNVQYAADDAAAIAPIIDAGLRALPA